MTHPSGDDNKRPQSSSDLFILYLQQHLGFASRLIEMLGGHQTSPRPVRVSFRLCHLAVTFRVAVWNTIKNTLPMVDHRADPAIPAWATISFGSKQQRPPTLPTLYGIICHLVAYHHLGVPLRLETAFAKDQFKRFFIQCADGLTWLRDEFDRYAVYATDRNVKVAQWHTTRKWIGALAREATHLARWVSVGQETLLPPLV